MAPGSAASGVGFGDLWIGGANGTQGWFNGIIDEIRLSGDVFPAAWAATLYRSETGALVT